jgi:excisionase family DNA binding protein
MLIVGSDALPVQIARDRRDDEPVPRVNWAAANSRGRPKGGDAMRDECEVDGRAWLTVGEVARAAGVHRYTVYGWIARGRLQPLPTDDGTYRIAAPDLARLLATRRAAATAGVRVATLLHWAEESPAVED